MFFEKVINKIMSEKNVEIDLTGKNNFDIYEELVEQGVEEKDIIQHFEDESNLPFINIMEYDPNYELISKISMSKIKELCIFPFKKENVFPFK